MLALLALLAALSPVPAESRQLVLCAAENWDATRGRVQLFTRDRPGATWKAAGGRLDVSLGRSGLAWGRGLHPPALPGPVKKEGDGRSPAGVFELRMITGEAGHAPEGTRLSYRQATSTLRCVDDPRSAHYNRLVDEAAVVKDWTSAEEMRRADGQYRLTVWVGHNDAPPVPEAGSCIFLHIRPAPEAMTAGCTAFDADALEHLVRWLDPAARPVLVQLPLAALRGVASVWGLPAP